MVVGRRAEEQTAGLPAGGFLPPASSSFFPAPVSAAMLENSGGVGSGEFCFSCLCVCAGELSLSGGAARGSPRSLRREGCWNNGGVVSSCATVSRARCV